ncbi:MAG: bifunctional glycosyltransferase family 2/GtrA family protein [Terracidiphilus sp.]|nr:bifunctional glycosyltransferase family 2/GtrA family protein [Terracidiphilus sp.]
MEARAFGENQPVSMAHVAVLIPARRLEPALAPLVDALLAAGFGAIILVDDGSPAGDKEQFDSLARLARVHLLRHAVNLGKGRALKTGINYFLTEFPSYAGLVTADADGQHSASDIVRIAQALLSAPGRPVLGCRSFAGQVPLRSRWGNSLTRILFYFVSGQKIGDTQTGLRGFPAALLPDLVTLQGERYEYEMTVLASLCRQGNVPVEVPISTIYIDNNRSSQFNPVRDSMRIYFVLLRFYASSLISAGIDFAGFSLTFVLTRNVLASIIVGRLSSLANFLLNRRYVFRSRGKIRVALGRYYLLAFAVATVSYGLIIGLTSYCGWNVFATKVIVDTLLSLATFSIQRTLVFPRTDVD